MTTLVVNGYTHVSLPDLKAGDIVSLVGDKPNVVLDVAVFGNGRAYLLVQTSALTDPVKVWLRRHSLIQLLSEPRRDAPEPVVDIAPCE